MTISRQFDFQFQPQLFYPRTGTRKQSDILVPSGEVYTQDHQKHPQDRFDQQNFSDIKEHYAQPINVYVGALMDNVLQ